jgi:dCMP deaminase
MTETKPQKYMRLAQYNAELFSKDPHTKVGAIILTPDFLNILSCGINGFPSKVIDTNTTRWERPTKYDYVIHAEINAVCNAAKSGTPLNGSVVVVTLFPCKDCTKALIQAGIKKIYAPKPDFSDERWGRDFEISCEMFKETGIQIEEIDL